MERTEDDGTYSISPARYAKGKVAVSAPGTPKRFPGDMSFKTRAGRLAQTFGKYSNREKAFIMSPAAARKFEVMYLAGADASPITGERFMPQERAHEIREKLARSGNPPYRYTTVAVDRDGSGPADVAYVARSRSKQDAIRQVAHAVEPDDWLDVGGARTSPTKHQAIARAHKMAPEVAVLARRLARGETK